MYKRLPDSAILANGKKLLAYYEKCLALMEKKLELLPEEDLKIRKQHGSNYYYLVKKDPVSGKKKEQYYSKSEELFNSYAQKLYLSEMCTALKDEHSALSIFLKRYRPGKKYELLNNLPIEILSNVKPEFYDSKQLSAEWLKESYIPNPYEHTAVTSYTTNNNEIVRSRAECIIANVLKSHGLAYKYEAPLSLRGLIIYPDFTIMHPDSCELYYLEFFGMMAVPDYAQKAFSKVQQYQAAGLGSHLIAVFETAETKFNQKVFEKIVDDYFLL